MGARGAPLLALLLPALLPSCAGQWPWTAGRFFETEGDRGDDRTFAGTPTADGGYRVDGATSCDCDLTANECDPNCCCDTACSSAELRDLFGCRDGGGDAARARAGVPMCSAALAQVNVPDTVVDPQAAEDGSNPLAGVLCVQHDNSASYGAFVDPAPAVPKSEFGAAYDSAQGSSFEGPFAEGLAEVSRPPPSERFYAAGQPLNKGASGGGEAPAADWAPATATLALGGALPGAACDEGARIPFLEELPPTTCTTHFAPAGSYYGRTLEEACTSGTTLDARALADIRLGTSALSPSATGYETVSVSIAQARHVPWGGSERSSASASSPSWNETSCDSVLIEAYLRMVHDREGRLVRAEAYVTLTDVPAEVTAVERTFGVSWEVDQDGADSDSDDAEAGVRPRSGRPGYIRGLPVLSARDPADLEDPPSDPGGLQQSRAGLVALVTNDGTCEFSETLLPLESEDGAGLARHVVRFGQDAAFTCALGLSREELRKRCEDGDQYVLEETIPEGYVGRYGDSYTAAKSEWVPLERDTVTAGSWDADAEECTGFVLGAHLQFLTAASGAAVDLQEQIIGARLSFRKGTYAYGRAAPQLYTVTASFARVPAGSAVEFEPPAPTLFAPLPEDVFYPFTLSASGAAVATTTQQAAS